MAVVVHGLVRCWSGQQSSGHNDTLSTNHNGSWCPLECVASFVVRVTCKRRQSIGVLPPCRALWPPLIMIVAECRGFVLIVCIIGQINRIALARQDLFIRYGVYIGPQVLACIGLHEWTHAFCTHIDPCPPMQTPTNQ